MSNSAAEMIGYIEKVRHIFAEVPRIFEKNDRRIEQLDKESGDLMHAIELLEYDEEQGIRYIEEIKENRRSRRRCKDQNLVLKPLYDYIKAHPKILQELRLCEKESEKLCQVLADRKYYPRIRMELAKAFEQQAAGKGGDDDGQNPDQGKADGTDQPGESS